jgi:hypothetical protein
VALAALEQTLELSPGALAADAATHNINITLGGLQVPWVLLDETILFYGDGSQAPFADSRIYSVRVEPGLAMTTASRPTAGLALSVGIQTTYRQEQNTFAGTDISPDPNGDIWFWRSIATFNAAFARADIPFTVSNIDTAGTATATLNLHGATPYTHHLSFEVNGTPLRDFEAYSRNPHAEVVSFDAGLLLEGANTLSILARTSNEELDIVYLENVELSVPTANADLGADAVVQTEFLGDVSHFCLRLHGRHWLRLPQHRIYQRRD